MADEILGCIDRTGNLFRMTKPFFLVVRALNWIKNNTENNLD